ncbi:MAG: hypothetical protein K2Z81_12895, partial [Cyanobacteria bacterium]|nr:hypothetical protein [Cyanobacteriota bacterium]
AAVYEEKSWFDQAISSLQKAISLDPSIAESYVMMTAVCLQQNDSVGADKAIADGLKRLPQNPFLLFTVASLKYQQKDTNGALKAVSEILSLHPDHAMTYTFDAQIQTQLKNWAAVKKDLDSLLSLERPIPSALDFVSLLNYKLNSVDRYKTLIQRANVNRELGDFQSALSDAKDAIKLKSGEASGYFELARSTYLLEKFEDACDAADSCVRLSRYLDQDMYFLQALASLAAMKPSATQFARNRFQWIIEHYNGSTFEPESNQSFLSAVYLLLMDKSRSDKSAQDELSPEVLKRLSEIPAGKWPSPMRDFLQGKIDEKQLYAAADTDLKRSQLHCMLGLKYFFEKRMSIANQQFEWVCKNSKKSCDEYPICQSYSRILTKKK